MCVTNGVHRSRHWTRIPLSESLENRASFSGTPGAASAGHLGGWGVSDVLEESRKRRLLDDSQLFGAEAGPRRR